MEQNSKYPSVDLAYEIAIDSFEKMRQQWNSVNRLFHSILSISLSITAAVPLIAKTAKIEITGFWIILTLLICFITVTLCLWGRHQGSVRLINPGSLHAREIQKEDEIFKRDMVYYAGVEFEKNQHGIRKKWHTSVIATLFLAFQVFVLVLWVAQLDVSDKHYQWIASLLQASFVHVP